MTVQICINESDLLSKTIRNIETIETHKQYRSIWC